MNKPLKFSSAKTKLLWCSDFHQQHQPSWPDTPPLWKSRGFTSIEDHDAWIKDQWLRLVDEETVVVNAGDSVFSDPKGERFLSMTLWPGRHLILNGNHVSGHRQVYRIAAKAHGIPDDMYAYPLTLNHLTFAGDYLHMWVDGVSVYAQHYAQYLWPELSAGGLCICGHSHARCDELNPTATTHGKILDVSLDNAIATTGTPFFDWPTIQRVMAAKPVVKRDHH